VNAKKTTLAAAGVMLTALVGAGPAAQADPGDTLRGGCAFATDHNDTTLNNGQNRGVIYDLSASQEASGAPSGATVTCWIDVNGSEYPGTRVVASGNGVQASSARVAFVADDLDAVALCQQVTFDDGSTWVSPDGNNPDCPATAGPQFPPQFVIDAINTVLGELPGGVEQLAIDTVDYVLDQLPGATTALRPRVAGR